jgi:C1A family cysteine protease
MTWVHSTYIHDSTARKQILEEYSTKSVKQLFKVWHFLFSKNYDYNSQVGIEKYKIFRTNWNAIKAHNANPEFKWKQGLNELSDMTTEQIIAYYNIKNLPVANQKSNIRSMGAISLDDYNDEDEKPDDDVDPMNVSQTPIDWSGKMPGIRNQGGCGSCWAFCAAAAIEGMYGAAGKPLTDWISTQEFVDCDTGNSGCNGGWPTKAFSYVVNKGISFENTYPYMGYQQTCNAATARSSVKVSGFYYNTSGSYTNTYLAKGPLASAMAIYNYSDPAFSFFAYAGGIYDSKLCVSTSVNHGVNLVGYGVDATGVAYWKVRNSWGEYWGENGYFRISNFANNFSCYITRYTMQPYIV